MTAVRGSDSASRPIRRAEDTTGAARDAGARHRPVRAAKGIGGVVGAVCVWEILRATSVLPETNAPSVGAISSALFNEIGEGPLATAAAQTAYAWAVGFATAAAQTGAGDEVPGSAGSDGERLQEHDGARSPHRLPHSQYREGGPVGGDQ